MLVFDMLLAMAKMTSVEGTTAPLRQSYLCGPPLVKQCPDFACCLVLA